MRVHERYIDFNFQHRNESNSECFDNRSKTFVLYNSKFVDQWLDILDFLENVSDDEFVDDRRSNHNYVDLFNFNEDYVLCRDWDLRESHELIDHFLLNFSNVWFSSTVIVGLGFEQNLMFDSRLGFRSNWTNIRLIFNSRTLDRRVCQDCSRLVYYSKISHIRKRLN
jgi:hypothetical protein